MKKQVLFYISLLLFMSNIYAQSDSTKYVKNLSILKQEITSLKESQKQKRQSLTNKLNEVQTKYLKSIRLDSIVSRLEKKDKLEEELEFLNLKDRYTFGLKAINEMEKGVTLITFMQEILQLQQEINNITNLWSDNDIRNGYDKVGDILTIAGPIVAGGLMMTNNIENKKQKIAAGGSISLIAIGQLIKKIFGKESAKKYEFIDMTRKSYDNLVVLNQKLTQFINSNSTFEERIRVFKRSYEKNQLLLFEKDLEPEKAGKDLIAVISFIDEYQMVLSQIPKYIYELKGILLTYSFEFYKEKDDLIQTIHLLKDKANKIESKYNSKVRPLLEVSPDLKTSIYGL